MAGKGSSPRPIPDRKTFYKNFDAIFKKEYTKLKDSKSKDKKEKK